MIEVKDYLPKDAIELCGDDSKRPEAEFNQLAGPAHSLFHDGQLVGCGGVRGGMGEAWFLMADADRTNMAGAEYQAVKKDLLLTCRQELERVCRESRLYRLIAETKVSETFLKHMGFVEKRMFVSEL